MNVIIFGAGMSSSVHFHNKNKNILNIGENKQKNYMILD